MTGSPRLVTELKEEHSEKGRAATVAGVPISVVRWGFVFFVAASVAGFLGAFVISGDWTADFQSFLRFNPIWFVPAAGLMVMDWVGGGLRFRALVTPQDAKISLLKCIQVATAGTAMGYLTPASTGAGPANIYGLMRAGLSLGRAAAVNAASFLANVIFLSAAGLTVWGLGLSQQIADIRLPVANLSAAALFRWTALVFGSGVGVIVLFAVLPGIARAIIRRTMGSDNPRIERVLHHFDELHAGLLVYWKNGKLSFLAAILSGGVQFSSRFLLGWVILKGFVAAAPFVQVTLLHIVLQYLIYVMPTPGGTGGGEVIAAVIMAPFMPAAMVVPYTAVWRIFLTYGTVAMGASIMLNWLGKDGAR